MEEYLRSLRRQLSNFTPDEQTAIMDEIQSHVESGEAEQGRVRDAAEGTSRLMKELGSSQDMGDGFRSVYRPNRFVDYILVAVPFAVSLYLHDLYLLIRPQYAWVDIRFNVFFDLILILVGLGRRSALITLFWINLAVFQTLYIVLQGIWQPYWYSYWDFQLQTVVGTILLIGLLALLALIVWRNRHDTLIIIFAVLPLGMELLGTAFGSIRPASYAPNLIDRSLLVIFLRMQAGNAQLYGTLAAMAIFFLVSNRDARWASLLAFALLIGLGREYLFDFQRSGVALFAQWVYYLHALVPFAMVAYAWSLDWRRRQQIRLAI